MTDILILVMDLIKHFSNRLIALEYAIYGKVYSRKLSDGWRPFWLEFGDRTYDCLKSPISTLPECLRIEGEMVPEFCKAHGKELWISDCKEKLVFRGRAAYGQSRRVFFYANHICREAPTNRLNRGGAVRNLTGRLAAWDQNGQIDKPVQRRATA